MFKHYLLSTIIFPKLLTPVYHPTPIAQLTCILVHGRNCVTQNSWKRDCAKNLQETSLKLLYTLLCNVEGLSLELRNAREGFLTNNQMQEYSNIARDAKIHKQTKLLQIVTSIYLHTRNIRTSFRSKVISLVSREILTRKQT